jgi:hypothetical protein
MIDGAKGEEVKLLPSIVVEDPARKTLDNSDVGVIHLRRTNGDPLRKEPQWTRSHLTFQRLELALVCLLVAVSICAGHMSGQNPQPENQSNVIQGTVINGVTREPIGRALVYSQNNRYAALTDGEGHFEFALPKVAADDRGFAFDGQFGSRGLTRVAGSLTSLLARKPGFVDDAAGRTQVEVSPGTETTIYLTPEALIKGRVTLAAADPARGIEVQLFSRQVQEGSPRWIHTNSYRTNTNGEFRFPELRPGSYKLLTAESMDNDPEATIPGGQLYGFPPVYYPSATDFASASTIQLTAGQTLEADLLLVRQPYYAVKIPVTNMEQKGGLNVTVSLQGQRGPGYSLGYNGGRGIIEGLLPNGKYVVEAAAFGPNSVNGSVNLTVSGAPVEGHSMVMARNNSVSVNVKEEFTSNSRTPSGSAWSDGKHTSVMHGARLYVDIRAEPMDDFGTRGIASIRPPTGPNDDSLVLENLVPGRYWLRFNSSQGYVASATIAGASTAIDVTMRDDSAELEGTLLGVPAASANSGRLSPPGYVYCIPLPDSPGQFLELPASSDGKFDYRMVTPGVYRVIAFGSHQPDLPYRDAEAMKAYETKDQVVHFAPGQKVTLLLQISE